MSETLAPALTYELNILASALGRLAVPNLDNTTRIQANILTETSLDRLLQNDGPPVPNTLPELLQEATTFDRKLVTQITKGPASELIDESLSKTILDVVVSHINVCEELHEKRAAPQMLVDPKDIAQAYGLTNLWDNVEGVIAAEVQKWGIETSHPDIPASLSESVSKAETEELVSFMWHDLLHIPGELVADIYLSSRKENYHLFWSAKAERLDYVTPYDYDRATQLSFDLPHNVAHLAHLSLYQPESGVMRYNDTMPERAFFEGVAVLSEAIIVRALEEDSSVSETISAIFNSTQSSHIEPQALKMWMIQDRAYEFKLRAARLYGEFLVIQGHTLEEAALQINGTIGIDKADALKEVKKYLPWIGLGALYTQGYCKALEADKTNILDTISAGDNIHATWQDFDDAQMVK